MRITLHVINTFNTYLQVHELSQIRQSHVYKKESHDIEYIKVD